MADENTIDKPALDLKPAKSPVLIEKPVIEPEPEPAVVSAKDRLREFEDKVLGKDAVRISGQIEKGHGSHFKTKMTEAQRHQHAALEAMVMAEEKVAKASAELAAAEAAHDAAEAKVEALSAADGGE